MSSGPERRHSLATVVLVAALVLIGALVGGCGSSASSVAEEPPHEGAIRMAASCAPAVALTERAGDPLTTFACPFGWSPRTRSSALPTTGRFTSAREMIDAFCTRSETYVGAAADAPDIAIDFEHDDVVAVAYDAEVGLFWNGAELWVRDVATTCAGEPPSVHTALFVVPKSQELRQQVCSRCE